jgi:hypothetical protein
MRSQSGDWERGGKVIDKTSMIFLLCFLLKFTSGGFFWLDPKEPKNQALAQIRLTIPALFARGNKLAF